MNLFAELSLVLIVATIVAAAMQRIKQPLIIGHIVTGILVGPYVFNVIQSAEIFELLSKLGVTLLLFIIGLSLNPKVLKEVGTPALVIGIGQIAGTALVGGTIAFAFGLSLMSSLFIGVALSLSSTIVILKLLSDMRQLGTLHGKITIGILVLQDIVASAALVTRRPTWLTIR